MRGGRRLLGRRGRGCCLAARAVCLRRSRHTLPLSLSAHAGTHLRLPLSMVVGVWAGGAAARIENRGARVRGERKRRQRLSSPLYRRCSHTRAHTHDKRGVKWDCVCVRVPQEVRACELKRGELERVVRKREQPSLARSQAALRPRFSPGRSSFLFSASPLSPLSPGLPNGVRQ